MELNKNIVKKYNRLFREVSKYYGVEDKIILWPFKKYVLSTIIITPNILFQGESKSATIKFLEEKYPHLIPFYILFFEMRNPNTEENYVCKIALHEINAVIKAIRKEKKILFTKNPCGEITLGNPQPMVELGDLFR